MVKATTTPSPVGAPSFQVGARREHYCLEVSLVSSSGLLLEISYTTIVSFKALYYSTYLVLGLALLGLGADRGFVAISERIRRATTQMIVMTASSSERDSLLLDISRRRNPRASGPAEVNPIRWAHAG